MSRNKIEKANAQLQREIADIINTKLSNPNIKGIISVLKVEVSSAELQYAKIYISIFYEDKDKIDDIFNAIVKSAGFIRTELAHRLNTHTIPKLHFIKDNSLEYSSHISNLLDNLK